MRTELCKYRNSQRGVFTREQALTEYSVAELRSRVARREWVRVFHGVYRESSTAHSVPLALTAARLSLNAEVAACRHSAAQLHGFAVLDDTRTHVLCKAPRTSRSSGLVVHRDAVGNLATVRGLLTTDAARTAIELARHYGRLDALAVVDSALRRGVTRTMLDAELTRQGGKRGIRQATELVSIANPLAESPMESRTRLRCIDAGLPTPDLQVVVRMGGTERRLDLGWERWKVGLEYESREWHSSELAVSRDNRRHNWLTDLGWQMFYATSDQVYGDPEMFTEPIRRALEQRRRSSA